MESKRIAENWQTKANEFAKKRSLKRTAPVYALDAMSELGEAAKEILLATGYGSHPLQYNPDIEAELGDLLYSVCMLATSSGVDLESAFSKTLEKYNKRWQSDGTLDSSGQLSEPARE